MNHQEKGKTFKVDLALSTANPDDYDGLLLPGGVANPDRTNAQAVRFVRAFFDGARLKRPQSEAEWWLTC
jgi:protease I